MVSAIERRNNDRLLLEVPVMVSLMDKKGKERSIELMTSNISSGGAFIKTDNPLKIGTEIQMDIILSFDSDRFKKSTKKSHIDIGGNVIRTERDGMAVCFNTQYKISSYQV